MAKRENVVVCDFCNERITNSKCEICQKDLCNSCQIILDIALGKGKLLVNKIKVCATCVHKVSLVNGRINIDEDGEIKKMVLERVKRGLILRNLGDSEGGDYLDRGEDDGS